VDSNDGLVKLPMEQLCNAEGANKGMANTADWTQKMRDAFTELASRASAAYEVASERAKAATGNHLLWDLFTMCKYNERDQ
jgi:hypothetical protein